jgi:hypothetical protein
VRDTESSSNAIRVEIAPELLTIVLPIHHSSQLIEALFLLHLLPHLLLYVDVDIKL